MDCIVERPSTTDSQSDRGSDEQSSTTRTRRSSWQLYTGQQQAHPRPLTSSRLDTTVNKQGGASTTDGQTNVDADNGDSCTVDRDSGIQRPQTSSRITSRCTRIHERRTRNSATVTVTNKRRRQWSSSVATEPTPRQRRDAQLVAAASCWAETASSTSTRGCRAIAATR